MEHVLFFLGARKFGRGWWSASSPSLATPGAAPGCAISTDGLGFRDGVHWADARLAPGRVEHNNVLRDRRVQHHHPLLSRRCCCRCRTSPRPFPSSDALCRCPLSIQWRGGRGRGVGGGSGLGCWGTLAVLCLLGAPPPPSFSVWLSDHPRAVVASVIVGTASIIDGVGSGGGLWVGGPCAGPTPTRTGLLRRRLAHATSRQVSNVLECRCPPQGLRHRPGPRSR